MNKILYILLFSLLFSFNNVSANTGKVSHNLLVQGSVVDNNFTKAIKIQWSGGLPLVNVVIEGETHTFLFDTGAFMTIPVSLVKKLGLQPLDDGVTVHDSAGGTTKTQMYTLPMMTMGGVRFSGFTVLANDFQNQFPLSCLGFDGIVGINALKDLNIKLDWENANLVISDAPIDTSGYATIDFNYGNRGGINFNINFEFGKAPFQLDTGKNDHMQIGDLTVIPELEKHQYKTRKKIGQFANNMYGINDSAIESHYLVKNINIDNQIAISSIPVSINNSKMLLIGNKFLKHFEIVVDLPNKKLSFKKHHEKAIADGFKDTFGFTPMWDEKKKLYISAITEGTPAYKAGLKTGNQVIALNNRDTKDFTSEEFCSLVKSLSAGEKSFDTADVLEISTLDQQGKVEQFHLSKE